MAAWHCDGLADCGEGFLHHPVISIPGCDLFQRLSDAGGSIQVLINEQVYRTCRRVSSLQFGMLQRA